MKHFKLPIIIILASLALTSCAKSQTSPQTQTPTQSTDQTAMIQFYKDSITQLQSELSALKEETYILSTEYELKIRELEAQIESFAQSEAQKPADNNDDPNQNIVAENPKAYYEYHITTAGAVISKYTGDKDSVQVPSSIDGRPVVKILEYAFSETMVKSVILPDGMSELDWFAFYKCPFLEKIYIPASVTSIGYGAFDYCPKSLTIFCEKDSYAEKYAKSFGMNVKNQ